MNDDDSGFSTLATQGSITFAGNILGRLLGFTFVAVSTRLVSKSEFGLFTLGLAIVGLVQAFASLNIYRSVDYFVPQYLSDGKYGKAKLTLRNAFVIGVGASALGALVLFTFRHFVASVFDEVGLESVLFVFVLLIPIQTAFRTLISSFNAMKRMSYRVVIKDLLSPLMRTIFVVGFVLAGAGIMGLVSGYILGIAVAVLLGTVLLFNKANWIQTSTDDSVSSRSLISYSFPLVFAGIIYSLVGQLDYFVIGYFLTSADVAEYRVAFLLAGNTLLVLAAVGPVFKPLVAENMADTDTLRDQYQLATRWVTMLTIPLAITLAVAPSVYLSILFTEEFALAGATVAVLSIGYLLNASFGPDGMILEGLGYTKLTLFNTLVLVSVNGILDLVLVPRLGILGAGIATGTALTVAGAAGVCEIYLLRSVSAFNRKLLRVWIAAAVPISVGIIVQAVDIGEIPTALVLPVVIGCSYLMGLRLSGGFSDEDRMVALRVDDRLGYKIVSPIVTPNSSVNRLLNKFG
jgi:O-antigen/teichoic acid export membrane protein